LTEKRCLLVSRDAGDRHGVAAEKLRVGLAEHPRRVHHTWKHRLWYAENTEQIVVPALLVNVEEKRARGVGVICRVDLSTREFPNEPGVDRSEAELPLFRSGLCSLHVVEKPTDLVGGKIRVDHQARLVTKRLDQSAALELCAERRRAAVLPDDGARNCLASPPTPHESRLALVRDADRREFARGDAAAAQGLLHHCERDSPDFFGVVLDPAGTRIVLAK